MITGLVTGSEGRLHLTVIGPSGEEAIEAVVDTGYSAWLTLPPSVVSRLGLRWRQIDRALLADGSDCFFDVYWAAVRWDGEEKQIQVDEADSVPLVGMQLMGGFELMMQVCEGGGLTMTRLPQR